MFTRVFDRLSQADNVVKDDVTISRNVLTYIHLVESAEQFALVVHLTTPCWQTLLQW